MTNKEYSSTTSGSSENNFNIAKSSNSDSAGLLSILISDNKRFKDGSKNFNFAERLAAGKLVSGLASTSAATVGIKRSAAEALQSAPKLTLPTSSMPAVVIDGFTGGAFQCRRPCTFPGCNKIARKGPLCFEHRKGTCLVDGCSRKPTTVKGGFCVGHGAKIKECRVDCCNGLVKRGGYCTSHVDRVKQCESEGCKRKATGGSVNGNMCVRHGGVKSDPRVCKVDGCTKFKQNGTTICFAHGAKRPVCSIPDCEKYQQKNGLCAAHGGKKPRCRQPTCEKYARKGGMCIGHGAVRHVTKPCVISGCTRLSQCKGGLCMTHRKAECCSFKSCDEIAVKNRCCDEHMVKRSTLKGCDLKARKR